MTGIDVNPKTIFQLGLSIRVRESSKAGCSFVEFGGREPNAKPLTNTAQPDAQTAKKDRRREKDDEQQARTQTDEEKKIQERITHI